MDGDVEIDLDAPLDLSRPLYRGLLNESNEELAFLWWAFDLLDTGIIISIDRAQPFLLSESLINEYTEVRELKKSTKEEKKIQRLLRPHEYTPEYRIHWSREGSDKFISKVYNKNKIKDKIIITDNYSSYIECKPIFDQNNMTREFVINQKWMWNKYGIFVNLIIPQILFEATFSPKQYFLTATGRPKKNTQGFITLEQFLNK